MGRIVFLNRFFHPDQSATSRILSDLAFHLSERGHDVSVITSRMLYDDAAAKLPRRELVRGVSVLRIASPRFSRDRLFGRLLSYAGFYISASWALLWTVRRGDVVVAKTDPPLISIPASLVARLRGARLVNWLQDIYPEVAVALQVDGVRRVSGLLRSMRNLGWRQAGANVAVGERMAEFVAASVNSPSRIVVVPNWSDGDTIAPVAREVNETRLGWGLADQFVVGYSGNLGRAHPIEAIVETGEILRHQNRVVLVFIGDGAHMRLLKAETERRKLGSFMFLPYQDHIKLSESLSAVDVHLVSLDPRLEGYVVPSKIYGVLASARPAIFLGDGDGEVARLLRAADCGVTVAPDDGRALARAILGMADEPGRRQEMGDRGRRILLERFDRRLALERWEGVLDSVESGRHATRDAHAAVQYGSDGSPHAW